MKLWRAAFFVSLGGLIQTFHTITYYGGSMAQDDERNWLIALTVSALGWAGTVLGLTAKSLAERALLFVTGRPQPLPAATDPKVLAAEVQALNAQIAQLRDTATSFDMAFDRNLECLDERLRQVEQRTAYVPPTVSAGRTV